MKTAYLAGPMRDYPNWNFPAFDANAAYLRAQGWDIISPADLDRAAGFDENTTSATFTDEDFRSAMRRDYEALLTCDAIFFMPGWEKSTGANLEYDFATKLGIDLFLVDCESSTPIQKFEDVKDKPFYDIIHEITAMHDKKQKDYGTNEDPLANIRAAADYGVEPWIGCLVRMGDKMQRLKKAARGGTLANESIEDSLLDLAVYSIIDLVLYRESDAEQTN